MPSLSKHDDSASARHAATSGNQLGDVGRQGESALMDRGRIVAGGDVRLREAVLQGRKRLPAQLRVVGRPAEGHRAPGIRDRKSVGWGKGVSVRVDTGGRSNLK